MKKILSTLLILYVVVFVTACSAGNNFVKPAEYVPSFSEAEKEDLCGPYVVNRVVDGDTIIINIDGKNERVRFIGVNTPESVSPNEELNCENGKRASAFTKSLLNKKQVYLEYDVETHDKYNRILAYVYTTEGTMVNALLLQEGMAETMKIKPNVKYAEYFNKLEDEAKESEKGFWCK